MAIIQKILKKPTADKVIVVSEWTNFLVEIMAKYLDTAGIEYETFIGETKIKERAKIISEFNKASTPKRVSCLDSKRNSQFFN